MGRLSSSSVLLLYCLTLFGSCNLLLQSVNGEEEKGSHEQEQPQQQQWPWRNLVGMTIVKDADKTGAVCLDGSLPAYHMQRGIGNGSQNWILQFEGGGWCSDVPTCLERSLTRRGSTSLMNKYAPFSGILSNNSALNPDFYNWNRVKIRYCDGASFGGDSHYTNATTKLFFRGQRIWKAILQDLLPKGLGVAEKALLSGCSAGGLATFLHCDDFRHNLPNATVVKCLSDAGFFLDVSDVSGENTISSFVRNVTSLQVVNKTLNRDCVASHNNSYKCFFPQYALANIQTPYFILNSAYDVFQFHHIFVPPSADLHKVWKPCKLDPRNCTENQISILQGYRNKMLTALKSFEGTKSGGMFINSCFAHCQSESQDTWLSSDSPRLNNKATWEVVGDWYFERRVAKEVDCPYPCDNTCHNLIPASISKEKERNLIPASISKKKERNLIPAPPDMVGTDH